VDIRWNFVEKLQLLATFWARPARLPDGKDRSESRVIPRRCGLTSGFLGDQGSSLQGNPENCNIDFR
jgi:hypothetical protein